MRSNKLVWVLEDDSESAFVYREILEPRYRLKFMDSLSSFREALGRSQKVRDDSPDLVIADLCLSDGNFMNFLTDDESFRLLRTPFVVISSNDDLDILRACYDEGAVDYLTKPFKKAELVVKIERQLQSAEIESAIHAGETCFDPRNFVVKRGSEVVCQLTAKEIQIFLTLYRSRNKPITRRDLEEQVWKDVRVGPKTLDVHLFNLRRKLLQAGIQIRFISPDSYVLLCDRMDPEIDIS